MFSTKSPFEQFFDLSGTPLDGGYIYFGAANQNPETAPIQVYWDAAGATPVSQPVRTLAGYMVHAGTPAMVFCASDYSMLVKDKNGRQVFYAASSASDSSNVQAQLSGLQSDLASTSNPSKGAGSVGFGFSNAYPQGSAGWGISIGQHGYNALRDVPPAMWAAIMSGTSSDDHTAYIVSANSAAAAAGRPLYLPGRRWNYKPTAPIEARSWSGDGCEQTLVYVDLSAYAGVVFRNTGGTWSGLQIREKTLSKTQGILMQLSDATTTNVQGGSLSFTGYANLERVWLFGGLVALDIGNLFTCTMTSCRMGQAGTGVMIVPSNDSSDNGYANTLSFVNCEVSDNNRNWYVNPAGGKVNCLTMTNGSIERALVSTSIFTNVNGLVFDNVYLEQPGVALSPVSITGCSAVYAKFNSASPNCDLTIGTNTQITIDGWTSGINHLLGADGTQTVALKGCTFPVSGNSPAYNWGHFTAESTSYNGIWYDFKTPSIESLEGNVVATQRTVVLTGGGADVYRFLDAHGGVQNKSVCGQLCVYAYDSSTTANSCLYVYNVASANNGTSDAVVTQAIRKLRSGATDPGASTDPIVAVSDGSGGAVKMQFSKSSAIASVTVVAQFIGMVAL